MDKHQAQVLSLLKKLGMFEKFSSDNPPSYVEFSRILPPELFAVTERYTGYSMSSELIAMVEFMYPVFIAALYGNRCFSLTKELVQLLRDTDIPAVPTELLKLPFPGICIDVPKGSFGPPIGATTRVLMSYTPKDRFRVVFSGGPQSSITHYVNFVYDTSTDLRSAISATKTRHLSEEALAKELIHGWGEDNVYPDYFQTDVFRLSVNAALYISSPNSDVKLDRSKVLTLHQQLQGLRNGPRRRKLESLLQKEKSRVIYIVGASIKLSEEYRAVSQLAATSEEGRKLMVKHRVRGHFRHQPYGPEGSQRKLKWIEPFWRGPDFAELVEKGYVVR